MPKKPIDYSKTVIYKLVCNDLNIHNVYVGSTTNMINRKRNHKSNCNNGLSAAYNQKTYRIIRLNGGWSNWSMILVENYPCINRFEAEARERYYTELLDADMNTNTPGMLNKIKRIEYEKNYNKKRYNEQNIKCDCTCGGMYTFKHRSRHLKSIKHQQNLDDQVKYEYQWEDGTPCTEQNYYDSI